LILCLVIDDAYNYSLKHKTNSCNVRNSLLVSIKDYQPPNTMQPVLLSFEMSKTEFKDLKACKEF
jgi:hypothetical protein